MIHYTSGNIFDSSAQALVNTVNTVGVMGKGLALQFKKKFPDNFKAYARACSEGTVTTGRMFVTHDRSPQTGEKIIINFPTKQHWRNASQYSYIEEGLANLVELIQEKSISSIAIPPLGAGNGQLEWPKVKALIEEYLGDLEVNVFVYEPHKINVTVPSQKRIGLTDGRALLLYVLADLVRNGEYVSEFSAEKVAYFIQKFGGKPFLKLDFNAHHYGPYSGKVRYVLQALDGSFITGYGDMDKKPFEPIMLIGSGYSEVKEYIENRPNLKEIADQTITFLQGFYSDFSLELLSSIDHIASSRKSISDSTILSELSQWNDRKRSNFTNPEYVEIAIRHLIRFESIAKEYV